MRRHRNANVRLVGLTFNIIVLSRWTMDGDGGGSEESNNNSKPMKSYTKGPVPAEADCNLSRRLQKKTQAATVCRSPSSPTTSPLLKLYQSHEGAVIEQFNAIIAQGRTFCY